MKNKKPDEDVKLINREVSLSEKEGVGVREKLAGVWRKSEGLACAERPEVVGLTVPGPLHGPPAQNRSVNRYSVPRPQRSEVINLHIKMLLIS